MLPSQEELSELLGRLYDAASDPTLWERFLQFLATKCDATSSALVIHHRGRDLRTLSSAWEVDPEASVLYQKHYGSLDLWAQRAVSKSTGTVCTSETLCKKAEIVRTEIYNDYMLRYGFEHGMFACVENSAVCWASVSLYRNSAGAPFEVSDLDIFQFLGLHLQRAFALDLKLSELKSRADTFETALDTLATAVIFLDAKGQIVHMNRSASGLISEHDGLLAKSDELHAENLLESVSLKKAITDAVATGLGKGIGSGGTVAISRRARPPLQVQISPIRNVAIAVIRPVTAVAFVHDPTQRRRATPEILRVLYSLTPAESRVAILLGDGYTPRKISEVVGVTEYTVRSQMKSIFSKTNVRRQSELVRLMLDTRVISQP